MNLIEKLNWRYATKRMNGQSVPQSSIDNILEAIRLSPSSMGLQPYHCFVVSDKDLLQKINAEACKQPQIIEGSHVIVFAAWKNIEDAHVDAFMQNIADTRNAPMESLDGFKAMIKGAAAPQSAEQIFNWNARQAYIGLGFGLVAAAIESVDATPMEGFDNAEMDKVLGISDSNLASVCVLTLGYRNTETDQLVHAKKVRRAKNDFFTMR